MTYSRHPKVQFPLSDFIGLLCGSVALVMYFNGIQGCLFQICSMYFFFCVCANNHRVSIILQ